ncbi:methyltransferase [Nocardioides marmoribigeumensis]|uniref:SAM-dependent methyltransferase n=1 Tax=Nocardioides marmoribigeumensis TaxID=433649 RepID=A0ABU2BRM8_9ACTN|nr:methyltransferase [Nocardioides marmoribigeumensis]MDR7361297.1 SAM-dependent methyltransferase [Nocardioides marmoribigeumensis]
MVGARESHSQTRSRTRTAVVWSALSEGLGRLAPHDGPDGPGAAPLHVLDIGGGTGGFAVRVAELGHRVTVVDPSPDALAILDRRSRETGVDDRVTGLQGDLSSLDALREEGVEGLDAVLCHGVLEIVDDPAAALAVLRDVLRPGGLLSLLCAQRHAAVLARAMAGHFEQALATLDPAADGPVGTPHRFTADELADLLLAAGFAQPALHAVRVFSDLVPSSLVDLEPGAAAALALLEEAVAQRPEYLTLATQVHALTLRT